ncbi:MAG: F-box-like domain-containing protein, partial [Nitrososphaerales archaeon]
MTITRIPFQLQFCVFSYLDERDLHFAWRSSKKLQRAADDPRLWKPFLEKRCIHLDAPDYHRRITEYFKRGGEVFRFDINKSEYSYALWKCNDERRHREYIVDTQGQNGDIVTLSRGRYEEIMGEKRYLDVYDAYKSFVVCDIDSTEGDLTKELTERLRYDEDEVDPDHVRFFLELGADPSGGTEPSWGGPLCRLLCRKHDPTNTEILKSLWQYPRADDPEISKRRQAQLPELLELAARYGSKATFSFIWSLYPYPSLPSKELGYRGTLVGVVLNPHLASDDKIIKLLLDAKAEISEQQPIVCLPDNSDVTLGTFNCALWHQYFYLDALKVLVDAGAKPSATV